MSLITLAGLFRKPTQVSSDLVIGSGSLQAADVTFRVQRGSTNYLWPTHNALSDRGGYVGAAVCSLTSVGTGTLTIDTGAPGRVQYRAASAFVGSVSCIYSITDGLTVSTATMWIECHSAAPIPLGANRALKVYSGIPRWIRPLLGSSGVGLVVTSVTAPPVGSAWVSSIQISSGTALTAWEKGVEVWAGSSAVTSYSLGVTFVDSLGRVGSMSIAVSIDRKPQITWPTGLGQFTLAERNDFSLYLGRTMTSGACWVNYSGKACQTCPVYSATMQNLAGGPYDQLGTFDDFFLPGRATSLWQSMNNVPADINLVRTIVYPLLPMSWKNSNLQNDTIWVQVSTTTGAYYNDWTQGWYAFFYRMAVACSSRGIDPSLVVFDMGWEFTGTQPWRVGTNRPAFLAAWRLMVDRGRAGANAARPGYGSAFKFQMRPSRQKLDGHEYDTFYPGSGYIDAFSLSVHDGDIDIHSEDGWNRFLFGSPTKYGWMEVVRQGLRYNKPIAFPEWDLMYNYEASSGSYRTSVEPTEILLRFYDLLQRNRDMLRNENWLMGDQYLYDTGGVVRNIEMCKAHQMIWRN